MKTILKPIAFNEKSYNVNLLHKALEVLGLPVSRNEAAKGRAGQDTLKQVRTLQAQLNVPIDDSALVNEATSLAIAEALEKRGLTAASRSFTVTGKVRLPNGVVKKRQRVLAFDSDLRGVSVYRDVKNITDIKKNGGFEFLGEAVSDSQGNYSITFYNWQYRQAKRDKANVGVYAIEGKEIIGLSRMVNSEDYSDKGSVRDIDVIITQEEKRTEYEVLMSRLNAFLKESQTSLGEIAQSRDQLAFTRGELDVDISRIDSVASAELLAQGEEKQLSRELLYGIGRQNIRLSWPALYKKQEDELSRAIAKSMDERIIRTFQKKEITVFLQDIRECAAKYMLDDKDTDNKNTLNIMLMNALPEEEQRLSFVNALGTFKGSDFREFWNEHLPTQREFKGKPELVSSLLLTQQLTMLTGNHQALVEELQVNKKLTSMQQLIDLERNDWIEIIKKMGVPDFIKGDNDEEKAERYAELMQGLLNAAFPTQRIAKMIVKRELPIKKAGVSKSISAFLAKNAQFDFAGSRIHNFKKEIKEVAGSKYDEMRSELMKIQRVFQVSTSPEAMVALMENKLHSAYTIASIPRKSFIKTYGKALGGEDAAFAIHQRASHISTRAEMNAMRLLEYSHGLLPKSVMDKNEYEKAMEIIKKYTPNTTPTYRELFGSPDICECEHCRSVYSPAAYFIDLLRFLWHGTPNDDSPSKTPLVILTARRPDLLHLPLTCENTNTEIPYIDLANEVMEYYTAKGSLTNFEGYNTAEATAEELRANPQNVNMEAYRELKDAKYPFTLPFHQPLDVIRIYSDHLKVSHYEALKAMNPQPDPTTTKAIEAESLKLSPEDYMILTGKAFDTTPDPTALHEYYGYSNLADFTNLQNEIDAEGHHIAVRVPEILKRTGLKYTELVNLIKTKFINPHQGVLKYIDDIFKEGNFEPTELYTKLQQIKDGTLLPEDDAQIKQALDTKGIAYDKFKDKVIADFDKFQTVITLYEPDSKCDLETTRLRSVQSIYEETANAGISVDTWSKFHRFIRLWKKLGWTIYETDLMLVALGEGDITTDTISKLESVSLLKTTTKLPINQLAVLWGNIDTYSDKSLYAKLFLNRAVQQINEALKADTWGNYLQDETEILADHKSAILAAFSITEETLDIILEIAQDIVVNVNQEPILNLQNISIIYRYIIFAKALKMKVPNLCKLISLFNASPFSAWDINDEKFTNISPKDTYEFYKLAASTKSAGFKSSVLEYIVDGTYPADSNLGLDTDKTFHTAKAIRGAFAAIEQDLLETPALPLTSEALTAKLSLTFQPEIVNRFIGIIAGTASFDTITDANLDITIPDDLAEKYTYIKGRGRLACSGIMTDTEQSTLKSLANVNTNFQAAVDELYTAPETFISSNLSAIFRDFDEAKKVLLNRPEQTKAAELEEKLTFIYEHFIPELKKKLRRDAITQHIASLIGLSEEAATLLIAKDIDVLITDLTTKGFYATYFNDNNWGALALPRVDSAVDFSWGNSTPDPSVDASKFSVRWKAYIAAPASGEYTLMVEVEDADEAFKLYLDDELILEKPAGDTNMSWEKIANLNAAQMHLLILEYTETSQNRGIRLRWKTATTAPEIIPASIAYPAAILDGFTEKATVFHRAAKFISGFEISETELDHFIADIDFMELKPEHWKRIRDYMVLRNSVPQTQALLTDVFALANKDDPALLTPAEKAQRIDELTEILYLATAWDKNSLVYLVDTHFTLGIDDFKFKNEIALNQLYEVMRIVSKTGISAQTIAEWGAAETDFDKLHDTAQLMKRIVKAKYEEEDWLGLAGNLSDKIRENQKQALISYLLVQPAIQSAGVEDADGLFEYFLIDVKMMACMDTSRIVQANAAIQMFVNRCLLNLESNMSSGLEKGVSPGAIDKDRWEWMKNYRVWEANRKVFLYAENWLEPEWRNDRSEFFKELESYLVQNDITKRSVEQAFRNYLTSLNEVANLEVCGMHRENYNDGKLKYLHVFARTHNTPYKFFYRRWNEYREWSAWEKVQVDIRCVEDGDNSGVHLIPVVWKKRLFLFWPEFMEKQQAPSGNRGKTVENLASERKVSELMPTKYWEIRLAWSEYVDGKWSPKQVSKEFIEIDCKPATYLWPLVEKNLHFFPWPWPWCTDHQHEILNIICLRVNCFYLAHFRLTDIQSQVDSHHIENPWMSHRRRRYAYAFSGRATPFNSRLTLELLGDVYLKNETRHKLLPVDTLGSVDITLDNPFFFSDAYRTYFVRPVDIQIIEGIRNLEYYKPYFPGIYGDIGYRMPDDIPDYWLDDYVLMEGIGMPFVDGTPNYSIASRSTNQPVSMSLTGSGNDNIPMNPTMMRSGNAVGAAAGARISVADNYHTEIAHINEAFNSVEVLELGFWKWSVRGARGLEFHTFYHPFSNKYVTRLNQGGLPGLMESDTAIPSDEGKTFEDAYNPNFTPGLVKEHSDFDTPPVPRTAYKENVCFDVYGANSLYNWELFFHAPLYIATRLSKNGKFEEAMKWFHYIFDPTTDEMPGAGESEISRYWKVLPFKTPPAESLENWFRSLSPNTDPNTENAIIGKWRDNPFDPHLVASNRPLAYMKHVVIKYVENLIAWGDSLFRQFTRESIYEALQIYVIANHILGTRPEFVPKRGEIKAETYYSLLNKWDDFSNALVQLENIFPYSSGVSVSSTSTGTSLLGIGSALYFCVPPNDKLLEYWDTVADRLFKIRHCMDIDGVERRLALFAPPISPEALIQAVSQGLSLGSILADLSSAPPIYRFTYLIQKANEFCADVKALGSALLAALEKKDAEELSRLRASHETNMLELVTAIRERQVLEAKANKENLLKVRETAKFRLQHYIGLLGNESLTVPAVPTIGATLTAGSQLPVDTSIPTIKTDVDESLVDSDERGVKLILKEVEELEKSRDAMISQTVGTAMEGLAGIFHLFPQIEGRIHPYGVGTGSWWGGQNLGAATSILAKIPQIISQIYSYQSSQAAKMASYIRREQEWTLQANLAAREIIQLDKQITSADIRIQVAEKELENHKKQIEYAKEVELFLKDKFTNQELYQWMKEQLFAVYKQSYNLAFDMAKKAEKAYKYELGTETASFIQYGYWDNSKQGLVSGEKLQLALRQMEKSYLEENRRELELTKSISLALLNPLALIELRETGKCYVTIPEELFDLDFQGHYFRRIKSVSLSVPCIAGPYTGVNCTLRLLKNAIRINTTINDIEGNYEHKNVGGLWTDDDRFRSSNIPVTSIATSTGQNDAGMFEFNFRDERYLPFEGSGAISDWQIELSTEKELRQFDYSTISDVILHLKYTARESGGTFKEKAKTYIKNFLKKEVELRDQPLMRMFSMRHEFPTEWHKFLHPTVEGGKPVMKFKIGKERFPFFTQDTSIFVMNIDVFARCTQAGGYNMKLSYPTSPDEGFTSTQIDFIDESEKYGGLSKVSIDTRDYELDLEQLDINKEITIEFKHNAVEDIYLVLHYKLNF